MNETTPWPPYPWREIHRWMCDLETALWNLKVKVHERDSGFAERISGVRDAFREIHNRLKVYMVDEEDRKEEP